MTLGNPSPLSAYLAKLENRRPLPTEERSALLALPTLVRRVEHQERILREGQEADHSVFLVDGLISRQKHIGQTSQLISLSYPGDAVDLQTLFFAKTDHALVAHELSTIAYVPHAAIINLCDQFPLAAKMLWHDTLVDSAIFREWALNIGHRRAPQRIGFLLLEMEARLSAVGRVRDDDAFEVNLTQQEIASALGLSLVHMNKSLRRLREGGLIITKGREIRLLDKQRLAELVEFDDSYLHLSATPSLNKAAGVTA